jgi:hypothetical protein
MSQRRDSLRSVENLAGYPGRILRPLSARLLPPTAVELEGLVDRDRLLDIHGRSRKRQIALAQKYGIHDYPQPGGGCMLTKEGFGTKLKELFQRRPEATVREVELLKWGRHFLLPAGAIYIVGRNQADNKQLESLAGPGDTLLNVLDHPGPLGLLMGSPHEDEDLALAATILVSYSDVPSDENALVAWTWGGKTATIRAANLERTEFKSYQL